MEARKFNKVDFDTIPQGRDLLLMTSSKVFVIGDWYGDHWRAQNNVAYNDEDIIGWEELPWQ